MSCSVVMLFTCTLVRSDPDNRKALGVKPDPLKQTARYWVGLGNKMNAQRERLERDSIQAWNEAMKNVFASCSKKMAVQVCTVIIVCSFSCHVMCSRNMLAILYV
jgi:hypothetical protein